MPLTDYTALNEMFVSQLKLKCAANSCLKVSERSLDRLKPPMKKIGSRSLISSIFVAVQAVCRRPLSARRSTASTVKAATDRFPLPRSQSIVLHSTQASKERTNRLIRCPWGWLSPARTLTINCRNEHPDENPGIPENGIMSAIKLSHTQLHHSSAFG